MGINFKGFADNDPIEVPDKKPKPSRNLSGMGGFSLNLPDGLNMNDDEMEELEKELRKDPTMSKIMDAIEDMLSSAASGNSDPTEILKSLMAMPTGADNNDTEEKEEEKPLSTYRFSDKVFLQKQGFQEIAVTKLDDSTREKMDEQVKTKNGLRLVMTDSNSSMISNIPFEEIKEIVPVEYDEYFTLYEAIPENPTNKGFYMAGVNHPADGIISIIPLFGNTFKLNDDDSLDLFNMATDAHLFANGKFIPESRGVIVASVKAMIVPVKKIIMPPALFGEIKNTRPSISASSDFLLIGNITSNEQAEAILLKKDAELDLSKTTFPLYVKFKGVKSKIELEVYSEAFFNTNLNETAFVDFYDLKFRNGVLYVEVDF